jgi:hypothetical protein
MQAEQKMTDADDRDAIARAIQTYVDGGKSGKSTDMKPAFHEGAIIYGYAGPDLFGGPIQILFDWVDTNPPASELKSISRLSTSKAPLRSTRVELYNWSGRRFTDMFTLLKTDGEWKITSKVFYLHPES